MSTGEKSLAKVQKAYGKIEKAQNKAATIQAKIDKFTAALAALPDVSTLDDLRASEDYKIVMALLPGQLTF